MVLTPKSRPGVSNARFALSIGLALACAAGPLASAADAQVRADTSADARAVVVYGPDTLFTLYGRFGPFSPAVRARAIEGRLTRWGPGLATGRDTIAVVNLEMGPVLLVNDEFLTTVLEADAAPTSRSRTDVAAAWAARIREVTAEVHRAESATALMTDAAKALAVTLALVAILVAFRVMAKRLYALLAGPRVPALRIKQFEVLPARKLGEVLTAFARVLRVAVTIVLLYVYVPLVLSFFPWTALFSRRIVGYVLHPLTAAGAAMIEFLPNLFYIGVIVLVARYVLRGIQLVFTALGSGALSFEGFHRSWAAPTYKIVRFLVLAFAAVVMFPYLPGAGSEGFKGVSLFLGVLISFGSSAAIGNIIAGVVLTYTNAFELGDIVQIGETFGVVIARTMLVTRIRTIKNEEITIPNGTVLSSQVKNFTTEAKTRGLILHTTVTIGYNAPWRQIHELLISAALATENIQREPKPFVLQTGLEDFYVRYEINAVTDKPEAIAPTYSALHQNIQDAFFAAGVEIMSPHYVAARDGNAAAIPAEKLPKGYRAPAFRVETGPREG